MRLLDQTYMKERVEQLEDIITELKTQSSAQTLIDLRKVIASQSVEITGLKEKLYLTQQQRCRAQDLFLENELYQTFQKMMRERDFKIQDLLHRLNEAKESQIMPSAEVKSEKWPESAA